MARTINGNAHPPLRRRDDKPALPQKMNPETGSKRPEFPSVSRPGHDILDPGRVRLGDGFITAEFPRRM
ncbi:MAG: hypothetical protein JO266_12320 [Acidobacteria bacterium]|nr:hypothetical protein [Acidobacteriota bacterium]MBV9483983.1 hypothetical protein [Acidobacteriota bacterium]